MLLPIVSLLWRLQVGETVALVNLEAIITVEYICYCLIDSGSSSVYLRDIQEPIVEPKSIVEKCKVFKRTAVVTDSGEMVSQRGKVPVSEGVLNMLMESSKDIDHPTTTKQLAQESESLSKIPIQLDNSTTTVKSDERISHAKLPLKKETSIYFDSRFVNLEGISVPGDQKYAIPTPPESSNGGDISPHFTLTKSNEPNKPVDSRKDVPVRKATINTSRPSSEQETDELMARTWKDTAETDDYELLPTDEIDKLLLDELKSSEYHPERVYRSLLSSLTLGLVFSPLANMTIPILFMHIWDIYNHNLYRLFNEYRRSHLLQVRLDPWFTVAEYITSIAMLLIIVILYWTNSFDAEIQIFSTGWDITFIALGMPSNSFIINYLRHPVVSSLVFTIMLQHILLFLRIVVIPIGLHFVEDQKVIESTIQRVLEIKENIAARLILHQHQQSNILSDVSSHGLLKLHTQLRLAEIQSRVGMSMSPLLWSSLSLAPYLLQSYFSVPWLFSFIPLFLACAYHYNRIERQKMTAAMSMICDTNVFYLIQKQFPRYMFDSDMQRSEWVNSMLKHTWHVLVKYGESKIHSIFAPILQKSCPSFARKLEISKLDLGKCPPTVLGIRVLEGKQGADLVELDMDFKWISDLTGAISLYFARDTKVTASVTHLQVSGTVRLQLCPLIPKIPPFGMIRATFFEKPSVDFALNFGDVDLMDIGYSRGSISFLLQKILRHALETLIIYPKWMQIDVVDPIPGEQPSPLFAVSSPDGVLNINILSCTNLIIGMNVCTFIFTAVY
jgi:hypothetical protein